MDKLILKNQTKLKEIAKKYNLAVFIVFGSRANDTFTKISDYDFAYFGFSPKFRRNPVE